MTINNQMKYWGIFALVFVLSLWFLGDIMLPYVLGGAIAYFLDPVADRLEALGLSRVVSTVIITLVGVLIFLVGVLAVLPVLVEQTIALFETMPELVRDLRLFISQRFPELLNENSVMHQTLSSIGDVIKEKGGAVLQGVLSSAASVVNLVMLMVVVPVVTFYLLLDWDKMVARVDDLLPREHITVIRSLASQIDNTLASFVRGMGSVCLILGTYYAIALMLVGLNFGLAVGFFAGAITFIPYIGSLLGGTLAIGLGLFQFWGDWFSLGLVGAIFVAGQIVEGNFLTPKLVGKSVGLHPVWLLFALSVFGALFGFVGMLVAVPIAAVIGVLARFFIGQYTNSYLYTGKAIEAQED
ncbi:AI-2E family transporter [Shimia thalassica]|uniref:Pheromone autoinducer 2 transporter n=1 Tax=Shimia thalassica TaxID=1715693 RepID=A0A0P1I464_9RHOB|nr:AI-2E family transporter [Shimia thalassica]MDO6479631.1 AI-2E family transporter [Shimia thalassica]MDO6520204.1 AI-2E family transporter [Shimia thalassica]MDO6797214.1 AI-2E family transporter [Shimia thalassica]CUJ89148.1 pheromone autoinducer 2 transporter [Shimia thalassica]